MPRNVSGVACQDLGDFEWTAAGARFIKLDNTNVLELATYRAFPKDAAAGRLSRLRKDRKSYRKCRDGSRSARASATYSRVSRT